MEIDKTLFEKVFQITNVDLKLLFEKIVSFIEKDYPLLESHFLGEKLLSNNIQVFDKFSSLFNEFKHKYNTLLEYRSRLYNTEFIELFSQLELINDKLLYIDNLDRWLRSSISTTESYSLEQQSDYLLNEGETLEKISRNILKRQNFLDNWYDLALSNSLLEENYTSEGGKRITIPVSQRNVSYSLNSVVDIIKEKSCYGRDISRRLEFIDEDLLILPYNETIKQSVEILVVLRKGDNLDFPNIGIQENMFIGSNRIYFNTPILIRQLTENFTTDDTLIDFQVKEIRLEQDNFFVNFQVRTILGEILNLTSKF